MDDHAVLDQFAAPLAAVVWQCVCVLVLVGALFVLLKVLYDAIHSDDWEV